MEFLWVLDFPMFEQNDDGSYSCMGMNAKVLSAKNRVYKIQTSLGTFSVNTRKGTVTKH